MKKYILGLLIVFIGLRAGAQQDNFPKKEAHSTKRYVKPVRHRPILFVNLSVGLNNNAGIVGGSVEVPLATHFSVEGGGGVSTWGSKLTASCKYYLKDDFKGWAFGVGATYNTGSTNFTDNLETAYGTTETVTLDLHTQVNVFAAAYKYWRLGKHSNRMYLELGFSVPVSGGPKFDQTSGDPISDNSRSAVNLVAPGGPVVGFGFSFAIH